MQCYRGLELVSSDDKLIFSAGEGLDLKVTDIHIVSPRQGRMGICRCVENGNRRVFASAASSFFYQPQNQQWRSRHAGGLLDCRRFREMREACSLGGAFVYLRLVVGVSCVRSFPHAAAAWYDVKARINAFMSPLTLPVGWHGGGIGALKRWLI